jgi:hypothetical protein
MKLLKEIPAAGLFEDLKGTTKWEISGMVVVNKMIHMIFDNLAHIGQVDERFQYLAPENALIEHATEKAEEDSLFESIEYSPSTFVTPPHTHPTSPLREPFAFKGCLHTLRAQSHL